VAELRGGGFFGVDQVDLGSVALQPGDEGGDRLGSLRGLKAEQAPELDRAQDLIRRNLE